MLGTWGVRVALDPVLLKVAMPQRVEWELYLHQRLGFNKEKSATLAPCCGPRWVHPRADRYVNGPL